MVLQLSTPARVKYLVQQHDSPLQRTGDAEIEVGCMASRPKSTRAQPKRAARKTLGLLSSGSGEQVVLRRSIADLNLLIEQFVDRPDTRHWCAHLGGCPTNSRDQAQLRGDDIAAGYGSEGDRGRRVSE
jgi:hypothetical protein